MGAIVTTVGQAGIFAVFTDRATQGPNTIESGSQPRAADLQIGELIGDTCSGLQDDLGTALWNITSLQPGDAVYRQICLKNNGAASVTLSFTAIDMVESDTQCTGDEQTVDPACGGGLGQGQLASLLQVDYQVDRNCDSVITPDEIDGSHGLFGLTSVPLVDGTGLFGGLTACVGLTVRYPSSTTMDVVQAAQTDGVSWKFAFDATAIE
jgi:hypothetical protein